MEAYQQKFEQLNGAVRVRFAPSPTGFLHIGSARTALFNYLFAKANNGIFILRIEDTDRERSLKIYEDDILEGLKWLGLNWDEGPEVGGEYGPYFQTQRFDTYNPFINRLIESNKAYKCFCAKEELDVIREEQFAKKLPVKYSGKCRNLSEKEIQDKINDRIPYVIRIKCPENESIVFNDLIRGEVKFSSETLDDMIIVRSDGIPVYNFVVTIDDILMKITHVIQGEDHLSNTPKQILLYKALGEKIPEFAHIPLILGKDKKRLSKRHGATSTEEYRKKGYPVEAFINFLALVGWAYDDKTTIFSREELVKLFTLNKVSKSGAVFDEEKLNWMSGVYIRQMDDEELYKNALPFIKEILSENKEIDEKYMKQILVLIKEKIKIFSEIPSHIDFFFKEMEYDEKAIKKLEISDAVLFEEFIIYLKKVDFSSAKFLEEETVKFVEGKGKKLGDIVHPVRASLTFKTTGPLLFDILFYLGKDKSINRLERGLVYAKKVSGKS